jgi:DNA-directed RNA polymerase subunit RPC12/RpoP
VASNNVICPACHGVINAFSARCKHCGLDFSADEEEEEETEDILVALGPPEPSRPSAGPPSRPTPRPSPGGADETIFSCSNCGKKLKVSNPKRPLTIRCPGCQSVETLKD